MATCIICLEIFTEDKKPTTLTQKGCNGIIKASMDHGKKIFPAPGDKVHHLYQLFKFSSSPDLTVLRPFVYATYVFYYNMLGS